MFGAAAATRTTEAPPLQPSGLAISAPGGSSRNAAKPIIEVVLPAGEFTIQGMSRNGGFLRKFSEFWPRGAAGPPAFPWLSGIVSRAGAYYWASAFEANLANVTPSDMGAIADFITVSLTATDGKVAEEKKRRCPKKYSERCAECCASLRAQACQGNPANIREFDCDCYGNWLGVGCDAEVTCSEPTGPIIIATPQPEEL